MFAKLQKVSANPKAKKLLASFMCLMVFMSFMTVLAAAEGTATDMTAQEAAQTIFDKITEQINVAAVVGVVAIGIGAGIALYFAWFAMRKVGRGVRKGLNGKSPF